MKLNLHLVVALFLSLLFMGGLLGPFTARASALKPPLPFKRLQQNTQLPPDNHNISSSQFFTYYYYLPLVTLPLFDYIFFPATGPAYAVPTLDDHSIYVGSGFDSDCQNTGQIHAFDKNSLTLLWKTNVNGAVGDTTLTLANNQVIFGAGDGVVALRTSDGRLVWQLHLKGCFQESFIRLYQGRIFIGSSMGYIYSITPQGQVLWHNRLPGAVFAAPAVFEDTLYFVDLTNRLTAVQLKTGLISWQKQLPLEVGDRIGIFASPLFYDNSLFIATYSHDVWRVSLTGQIEAHYSGNDRYVASPIICGGSLVVADFSGKIDWLEISTLQAQSSANTTELFIFGTPQCVNNTVVVASYGAPVTLSALYYLQQGQILERFEFPCCKSAVPATLIDGSNVYNVLTSLTSGTEEVSLTRSVLPTSP